MKTTTKVLFAILLAGAVFADGNALAVDYHGQWKDGQGITVDAANRNTDAIRRNRNREQRDLNSINETVRAFR